LIKRELHRCRGIFSRRRRDSDPFQGPVATNGSTLTASGIADFIDDASGSAAHTLQCAPETDATVWGRAVDAGAAAEVEADGGGG